MILNVARYVYAYIQLFGWLRRANPNEWVKYAIIYVSLVYV